VARLCPIEPEIAQAAGAGRPELVIAPSSEGHSGHRS
jgi:hypothetical protein